MRISATLTFRSTTAAGLKSKEENTQGSHTHTHTHHHHHHHITPINESVKYYNKDMREFKKKKTPCVTLCELEHFVLPLSPPVLTTCQHYCQADSELNWTFAAATCEKRTVRSSANKRPRAARQGEKNHAPKSRLWLVVSVRNRDFPLQMFSSFAPVSSQSGSTNTGALCTVKPFSSYQLCTSGRQAQPFRRPVNHHHHYPLTARVVGAPLMISQPVSSIFLCSPLPSGTWRSPGLSIPWWCLSTSSSVCLVFFPLSMCLARWFRPHLMNGRHVHTTASKSTVSQSHAKSVTGKANWQTKFLCAKTMTFATIMSGTRKWLAAPKATFNRQRVLSLAPSLSLTRHTKHLFCCWCLPCMPPSHCARVPLFPRPTALLSHCSPIPLCPCPIPPPSQDMPVSLCPCP